MDTELLKNIINEIILESTPTEKQLEPFKKTMNKYGKFVEEYVSPNKNIMEYSFFIPEGSQTIKIDINLKDYTGTIGNTKTHVKRFKGIKEFNDHIKQISEWWRWLYFATKR